MRRVALRSMGPLGFAAHVTVAHFRTLLFRPLGLAHNGKHCRHCGSVHGWKPTDAFFADDVAWKI